MRTFRSLLGADGDSDHEEQLPPDHSHNSPFSLSPSQKMYAFAICLLVGLTCMLLSLLVFYKPIKFAVLFTLGNLMSIGRKKSTNQHRKLLLLDRDLQADTNTNFDPCFKVNASSTVFLIGPGQQARMMLDPVRIYATIIYVGSVVVALVCAFVIHNKVLTLLAMIIECCALIWYSLSYVPFARRIVSELLISCCDTEI